MILNCLTWAKRPEVWYDRKWSKLVLKTYVGQNKSAKRAGRPGMLGITVVWRRVRELLDSLWPTLAATSNLKTKFIFKISRSRRHAFRKNITVGKIHKIIINKLHKIRALTTEAERAELTADDCKDIHLSTSYTVLRLSYVADVQNKSYLLHSLHVYMLPTLTINFCRSVCSG